MNKIGISCAAKGCRSSRLHRPNLKITASQLNGLIAQEATKIAHKTRTFSDVRYISSANISKDIKKWMWFLYKCVLTNSVKCLVSQLKIHESSSSCYEAILRGLLKNVCFWIVGECTGTHVWTILFHQSHRLLARIYSKKIK